jgi:hypothetical protein
MRLISTGNLSPACSTDELHDRWGYPLIVAVATQARRAVLAAGLVLTLGRWPLHWRHHPWLAVVSAVVVIALVVAVTKARVAALRVAAAVSLVDAVLTVRAWSARVPLHCDCVRRPGAPALAGWGGGVIAADVALCALAVWLARPVRQAAG